MDLLFRTATEHDIDRILEIHLAAYPDARTIEERRRNFMANVHGGLDDLVVAESRGRILAQAFLFSMEAWFGGRAVSMGAVASVAVAPAARSLGGAPALLHQLHVASDVRGDALTMLYAFRQRFYVRIGYGASVSRRRLAIDPASIPRAWTSLARGRIRAARGEDTEAIRAAYDRSARRASGWLVRSDLLWERHFARERRHFLVADGSDEDDESAALPGYVAFELAQEEAHGEVTLTVDELVADDDRTRCALLGALGAMRGQASTIEIEVDNDDPLEVALVDPDGRRYGNATVEHELGGVVGSPMVRIEDVPRAIEARGYAEDGAFDIVVTARAQGAEALADSIAVGVAVSGGRAQVAAPTRAANALRTSRAGLASILYGGVRVGDAARLGLVDADPKTLARADRVLALRPPGLLDPF